MQRVVLEAAHQDGAHAGEGVVVEHADRLLHHAAPGEALLAAAGAF
jgi:hypothetical protein